MLRICRFVPVLVVLVALCGPVAGDEPDADLVVERVIAALGGEVALDAVDTLEAKGRYKGVSGFPGSFKHLVDTSGRMRLDWDIGYISHTEAFDGEFAWEKNKSVRQLVGRDADRIKRAGIMFPLWRYAKSGVPISAEQSDSGDHIRLSVNVDDRTQDVFVIDAKTYLLIAESRQAEFEEGRREIKIEYADHRMVDGLMLPFKIVETKPDYSATFEVETYRVNQPVAADTFAFPYRDKLSRPYKVTVGVSPERLFRIPDNHRRLGWTRNWGLPFPPTDSWTFDVLVDEKFGRFVEPQSARIELYSGGDLVEARDFGAAYLSRLRLYPLARFSPFPQIYNFRHTISMPAPARINRMVYRFAGRTSAGEEVTASHDAPVEVYEQKNSYIFPVKGNFIITSGHEFYELEHKYERSQHFSIDIVALDDSFGLVSDGAAAAEDFYGFGRREIMTPADGTVVFARNDVPDGEVKSTYLEREDGLTAIAGNLVVIGHGGGEYSLFAHMRQGSVRVKNGDRLTQGHVIGLMGASGSPGLPHLHYQLQSGPGVFDSDGLPVVFDNVKRVAWLADDVPVSNLKRGIYYVAE